MSCKNQNQTISFETISLTVSRCSGTDISSYFTNRQHSQEVIYWVNTDHACINSNQETKHFNPFFIQANSNLYGLCPTELSTCGAGAVMTLMLQTMKMKHKESR